MDRILSRIPTVAPRSAGQGLTVDCVRQIQLAPILMPPWKRWA